MLLGNLLGNTRRACATAVLAAGALLLAACGGREPTSTPAASATPATTPAKAPATTPATAAATTKPMTEQERVIAAYEDLWAVFDTASGADDPALERVLTGELLTKTREQLRQDEAVGVSVGRPSPSRFAVIATQVVISGDDATLQACMIDDSFQIKGGVPQAPTIRRRTVEARLRRDDGRWRTQFNTFKESTEGDDTCD